MEPRISQLKWNPWSQQLSRRARGLSPQPWRGATRARRRAWTTSCGARTSRRPSCGLALLTSASCAPWRRRWSSPTRPTPRCASHREVPAVTSLPPTTSPPMTTTSTASSRTMKTPPYLTPPPNTAPAATAAPAAAVSAARKTPGRRRRRRRARRGGRPRRRRRRPSSSRGSRWTTSRSSAWSARAASARCSRSARRTPPAPCSP
mmetsp:Transcript_75710/g.202623  ORF Transcript_75710/g.202623 Transcript_75710/m.202623 type:complete len:205 (-) Transcript_75710:1010-1624(-)